MRFYEVCVVQTAIFLHPRQLLVDGHKDSPRPLWNCSDCSVESTQVNKSIKGGALRMGQTLFSAQCQKDWRLKSIEKGCARGINRFSSVEEVMKKEMTMIDQKCLGRSSKQSFVAKALGYWRKGYRFKSQNCRASMVGFLNKTHNSQLLSWMVSQLHVALNKGVRRLLECGVLCGWEPEPE